MKGIRGRGLAILALLVVGVYFSAVWVSAQGQIGTEDLFLDDQNRLDARDLFYFSQDWNRKYTRSDLLYFHSAFHTIFPAPSTPTSTPSVPEPTPTPTVTPTWSGTIAPVTATPSSTQTALPITPTITNTPSAPTPTSTVGAATATPSATHTAIPLTPTATQSVGTPTVTDTAIPATPTATQGAGTPTPTSTQSAVSPLPTATNTAIPATPTETVIIGTPSPSATISPASGTPTATRTVRPPTPTRTSTPVITVMPSVTPSPTDTPIVLPSPTLEPTLPPPTLTPTDTPTLTPTMAGTSTYTPTPSNTPTPTLTPTIPGAFIEFSTNFDAATNFADTGMLTLDESYREILDGQGRLPSTSQQIIPWIIYDASAENTTGYGVAKSNPKSAAFNVDYGWYLNSQTSILEIVKEFNTTLAGAPKLVFDIAFTFDEPINRIGDYLAVEVLRRGETQYELLDINGDGKIVTDLTAVGTLAAGSLREAGTFDGFYGTSKSSDDQRYDPLNKNDFIHVEVELPRSDSLKIAFRFESDGSIANFEGAYLDNVMVYDAVGQATGEAQILGVTNLDGGDIYVDTETRVLVQGRNLTPIEAVFFTSRDGEVQLPFSPEDNGISVVLPRLSKPDTAENANLRILRKDRVESAPFTVSMQAAPQPVIDSISPATLYLDGVNFTIQIKGNHFRPAFSGASEDSGTEVILGQNGVELPPYSLSDDFTSRSLKELVLNIDQIRSFTPGVVDVMIKNAYSGLVSQSFQIQLVSGAGTLQVDTFEIEVGGYSGHRYDPAVELFPLQTDHAFALIWEGSGFSTTNLNITIAGSPVVANSQVLGTVGGATMDVSIFTDAVYLFFSPNVIPISGPLTAGIQIGNGSPVMSVFTIMEPLPPILYDRDDDWSTQELSAAVDNDIRIYGDNFRGLSNGYTNPETISQVYLLPVTEGDPIPLPTIFDTFDVSISPIIADNASGEDILFQSVPADLQIPPGKYRLRVVNPDSGLYTDSSPNKTVTFTP